MHEYKFSFYKLIKFKSSFETAFYIIKRDVCKRTDDFEIFNKEVCSFLAKVSDIIHSANKDMRFCQISALEFL